MPCKRLIIFYWLKMVKPKHCCHKTLIIMEHAWNPRIQGVENYEFEATLENMILCFKNRMRTIGMAQ